MVRPYAIKGHKRKKREENYDREEVEQSLEEGTEATAAQDEKAEETALELPGIPIVPSNSNNKTGVTFILERACLEVAKVGKVNKFYLLSLVISTPSLLIHVRTRSKRTVLLPFQSIF